MVARRTHRAAIRAARLSECEIVSTPLPNNENLPTRVRHVAEQIRRIPKVLTIAFQSGDTSQRVLTLQHFGTQIVMDMVPLMTWLEMRRPVGTAVRVQVRLWHVLHEAVRCAGLPPAEYRNPAAALDLQP